MDKKEAIKSISKKISELETARRKLDKELMVEFQEQNKCNIGRCFRLDEGRYAIITDVPQIRSTPYGDRFNAYQFPCLVINFADSDSDRGEDTIMVPFEEDTLYTPDGVLFGGGTPIMAGERYEEILIGEFYEKFDDAVELLKSRLVENMPVLKREAKGDTTE